MKMLLHTLNYETCCVNESTRLLSTWRRVGTSMPHRAQRSGLNLLQQISKWQFGWIKPLPADAHVFTLMRSAIALWCVCTTACRPPSWVRGPGFVVWSRAGWVSRPSQMNRGWEEAWRGCRGWEAQALPKKRSFCGICVLSRSSRNTAPGTRRGRHARFVSVFRLLVRFCFFGHSIALRSRRSFPTRCSPLYEGLMMFTYLSNWNGCLKCLNSLPHTKLYHPPWHNTSQVTAFSKYIINKVSRGARQQKKFSY